MNTHNEVPLAIVGASSKIGRDLIRAFAARRPDKDLQLYVRDIEAAEQWLKRVGLSGRYPLYEYRHYGQHDHGAVINFVGIGDPVKTAKMGEAIFGLTSHFDDLILNALRNHPNRRYIFLSSGAAYGDTFQEPAGPNTVATIPLNAFQPQHFYGIAKLHAECKHRALPHLNITDLRIFNYFSRTQDLNARFLMTEIVRSIRDNTVLETTEYDIMRDYLHPADFFQLVDCVLRAPPHNRALDCYTREPVEKSRLLQAMQQRFGLKYRRSAALVGLVEATGVKRNYYSLDHSAADFGYEPIYSSLEGVTIEVEGILGDSLERPQSGSGL